MHDVESRRIERIYGRSPKRLYPPHLIALQYYSLLRFFVRKLATTFSSLQLCPEIIDILYPDCAQFIESCFQRFSSISRQAKCSMYSSRTVLVKPNFRRSYFACRIACTVTINQSLFATRFASWLFHCQISQIWRFSK